MGDRTRHTYEDWLESFLATTRAAHRSSLHIERAWSWARLLLFAAGVGCLFALPGGWLLTCGVAGGFFILFGYAVRRHRAALSRRVLADQLLEMIGESKQRCCGEISLLRDRKRVALPTELLSALPTVVDDGPTWALLEQEWDDLDLYSEPVGIYGLLNRTATPLGANRLRSMLEHPCLSTSHILARQRCVRQLQVLRAERLRIMAAQSGLRPHGERVVKFVHALNLVTPESLPRHTSLLRLWSVVTGVGTIAAVAGMGQGMLSWSYVLVLVVLINGAVYGALRRQLHLALAPWKGMNTCLLSFWQASDQASRDLPTDDPNLHALRTHSEAAVAPTALPALCGWVSWADSGGVFQMACNIVLLYDLHVASAIVTRAVAARETLCRGLAAMAEIEALCSLACFADESASPTCFADIDDQTVLDLKQGRHPLIRYAKAVPNDVSLDPKTAMWVITGSNMAGKSTLLRVTAINVLLAQAGTVSLAGRLRLGPMRLITDLQVRDNLAENESYFLAEVRHLKRMVCPPKGSVPVLGLMDEPFRGTNSDEQVAASRAVVEHLLTTPGLFLVATHERALAALAVRHPRAANYHFQEAIESTGMVFDYRLRGGPASTRNALRVLEREGFPKQLVAQARASMSGGAADTSDDQCKMPTAQDISMPGESADM